MVAPDNKARVHELMSKKQIETVFNFGLTPKGNENRNIVYERVHVGPYGTGKTRHILFGFGIWCKENKPGKLGFLLLGKTAQLAKGNMGDLLAELFGKEFKYTQAKKLDSKSKDALLYGHRVYFGGMNDKESIKRVLGKSYKAIIVDELTSITLDNYDQLKGRLRGDAPHWIECSTNPDSPNNWLYNYLGLDIKDETEQALYREDKNIQYIRWYKEDNVCSWAEAYYEDLKKSYGVGSPRYERGVLGNWCGSGDLVYLDTFNSKYHILKDEELYEAQYKYFKIGVDFGMENPTVALLIGVMEGGEHIILKEWYRPQAKNLEEIVKNIINMKQQVPGKVIGIFVDPSASALIKDLKLAGLFMVEKANNDVIDGIQAVNTLLTIDKLFVHESCEQTINEFYSYQYSKKDGEVVKKENDHCMDALRYGVMERRK